MLKQVDALKQSTDAYAAAVKQKLAAGTIDKKQSEAINRDLRQLEKAFIDPDGMAFGKWYKSLYAAPDPYSGYADWMLPAFLYEASLKSTANLPAIEARYSAAIGKLTEQINTLTQAVGQASAPAASIGTGKK